MSSECYPDLQGYYEAFVRRPDILAEEIHVSEPEPSDDPWLAELGIGKIPDDPVDPIPPEEQGPGGCC